MRGDFSPICKTHSRTHGSYFSKGRASWTWQPAASRPAPSGCSWSHFHSPAAWRWRWRPFCCSHGNVLQANKSAAAWGQLKRTKQNRAKKKQKHFKSGSGRGGEWEKQKYHLGSIVDFSIQRFTLVCIAYLQKGKKKTTNKLMWHDALWSQAST